MLGIYLRANISENMQKYNHRIALGGSLAEYFYIALHLVLQNELCSDLTIHIHINRDSTEAVQHSKEFEFESQIFGSTNYWLVALGELEV